MANKILWMAHPLSAYDGHTLEDNLKRARRWLAFLIQHFEFVDFAADWILWCEILDDTNEAYRTRGIEFDCEALRRLDGVILVGGKISSGMEKEQAAARAVGKPVINLTLYGDEPWDLSPGDKETMLRHMWRELQQ